MNEERNMEAKYINALYSVHISDLFKQLTLMIHNCLCVWVWVWVWGCVYIWVQINKSDFYVYKICICMYFDSLLSVFVLIRWIFAICSTWEISTREIMNICGLFIICFTRVSCLQCYVWWTMQYKALHKHTHTQHTYFLPRMKKQLYLIHSAPCSAQSEGDADLNFPCVNYYSIVITWLCLWYFHLHFNITYPFKPYINYYYLQFCPYYFMKFHHA